MEISDSDQQQPVISRRKSSFEPNGTNSCGGRGPGGRISKVPSVTEDFMSGEPIRMTGFLEKRSKVLGWKKYWFVLDAHLLTYYKSESDYESLSAFCGSINLGLAITARPVQIKGTKGYPLQITTRTHVYYLRSLDKAVLDQWLLALQETISVPHKISSPVWADPGVQFYRYSFASSSQWSLTDSKDDISGSLQNFPKNFYLKHERSSGAPAGLKPLTQKCQSLATLPTMSSSSRSGSRKSVERNSVLNPTELSTTSSPKVRSASSMLVLESSPEAAELKNELTRNMTTGQRLAEWKAKVGQPIPGIGKIDFSQVRLRSTNQSGSLKDGLDRTPAASVEDLDDYAEIQPRRRSAQRDPGSSDTNERHVYETVEYGQSENVRRSYRKSDNRNSLVSISEMPESTLTDSSKKQHVSFHENLEPDQEPFRQHEERPGKKKKGLGGLFQKIFRKGSTLEEPKGLKKKKSNSFNAGSNMVITGPVDLRNHFPPTRHVARPVENVPPRTPPTIDTRVIDELKTRVGQIQRTVSEGPGFEQEQSRRKNFLSAGLTNPGPTSTSAADPKSRTPIRRSTIQTTSEGPDKMPEFLSVDSNENYREKLERFNRISAHLSPSFLAALKTVPSFGSSNIVFGQMGRSNSCKIKATQCLEDEPPCLPPKAKHRVDAGATKYSAYDVPKNNAPVEQPKLQVQEPRSRKISLKELLAKKNSAPDVVFPQNMSSTDDQPLSAILNLPTPPPRPPKCKSPTTPDFKGFTSVAHKYRNLDSASGEVVPSLSPDTEVIQSDPVTKRESEKLEMIPVMDRKSKSKSSAESSPTLSNKSVENMENLDVLSDLSDVPCEVSPPDTPALTRIDHLELAIAPEVERPICCSDLGPLDEMDPIYSEPPLEVEDHYSLPPFEPEPVDLEPNDSIYENIKYATISTLITELETVEEREDDDVLFELYDEFPTEPIPTPTLAFSSSHPMDRAATPVKPSRVESIRHSGMTELQAYLDAEKDNNADRERKPAISKLGHSPALNNLQNILNSSRE